MAGSPWRNTRILSLLLLVFLTGSAAGALGFRFVNRQPAKPGPSWKEGGKEISLQRLRKDLDLTGDQTKEVEVVLDDFMMYYQTLQAQMDEVRANGKERILRILDPAQREKFKSMMSDFQRQIR
ncbi:MAG: hypothetical protein FJW39_22695 [Acidobacteria bacterium]|nr:hypothetical protein [Acidobacteriota bacterium]